MISQTTGTLGVCPLSSPLAPVCDLVSDVEIHHLEKYKKLRFENIAIAAEGPLRASLKSEVKYGQSTINVTVRVTFCPVENPS